MENMEKGLVHYTKIGADSLAVSQMPQNLSAQFVCPSPKVLDFDEKKASLGLRSPWYWRTR